MLGIDAADQEERFFHEILFEWHPHTPKTKHRDDPGLRRSAGGMGRALRIRRGSPRFSSHPLDRK
jgi:hypothetical protein